MKTAAEINAERIEAIIDSCSPPEGYRGLGARDIAQRIVEAFPELRPAQQSMDEHGRSHTIAEPLPWALATLAWVWPGR
jgi:hypothetical protein